MAEARPNLMRRRLGLALRTQRKRAGLSLQEAAERVGTSVPTLSRVELGKQRVTSAALESYLAVYGVPEARAEEAKKLASLTSSGRRRNLLSAYSDAVDNLFGGYLELEQVASHLDIYLIQVVPGLLQTEEYARALISSGVMRSGQQEINKLVELRMERRGVLHGPDPLDLWVIVEETALRRPVGGVDVLRRQLCELRDVVDRLPNVHLQVLPTGAGSHCGVDGAFSVFRFDAGDPVIAIESMTRVLYLEEDADVGHYSTGFNYLRAAALTPDRSLALIDKVIGELGDS